MGVKAALALHVALVKKEEFALWDKIQELLDKKGKTAYWLAKETGISETMIYSLRNGKAKDIGFTKMEKIADVLNVSLDEFRRQEEPQ